MKLIMVDLDGTLCDTRRVNYLAYQKAMERYGYRMEYEYYCSRCNGRYYKEFLPQITTDDPEILSQIHERKKRFYRDYLCEARLNTALLDLLRMCRAKCKIALVTTASRQNTNDLLDWFGVADAFDLILTREEVTKSKPDPEGFLKAMDYFQVSGDESAVFEDSDVGIQAALNAGAHCFVVKGYN